MEWFRWYHGTVNDPKFTIVARLSQQPKTVVVAIWTAILEFTSDREDRGSLEGFDPEDAAAALDLDTEVVVTVCHALSQKKLIDDKSVLNWRKRQPKREDDTATERKRNQREREKLQLQLADLQRQLLEVTDGHGVSRNVTQCHDRAEQSRAEQTRGEREEETAAGCTSVGSFNGTRETQGAGEGWPDDLMPVEKCLYLMKESLPKLKTKPEDLEVLQDICVAYRPEAIEEAFTAARAKGAKSLTWVMVRLRGKEQERLSSTQWPKAPQARSPSPPPS